MTADDEQDPNDWLRDLLGAHRVSSRDAIVSTEQDDQWFRDARAELIAHGQHALALARVARAGAMRPIVEYRCDGKGAGRRGQCILLGIYASPAGPLVFHPAYRYSGQEALRQKIQRREWGERAYLLDDQIPDDPRIRIPVACGHRVLLLRPDRIQADIAESAGRRVTRWLPDGATEDRVER